MAAHLTMLFVSAHWWEPTCDQVVNVISTKAPEPLVF
jgi:hypothetical protein